MNLKLKNFLAALKSKRQQERFAFLAETSLGSLRHLVTGRRKASAEKAIAIERAAKRMRIAGIEHPTRADLSEACRNCEYNKTCAGKTE